MSELELEVREIGEQRPEGRRVRAECPLLDLQGARVERERLVRRAAACRPLRDELQQDRDVRMIGAEGLDPLLQLTPLEVLEVSRAIVRDRRNGIWLDRLGLDRQPTTPTIAHPGCGDHQPVDEPPGRMFCRASDAFSGDAAGADGHDDERPRGTPCQRDRVARASPAPTDPRARVRRPEMGEDRSRRDGFRMRQPVEVRERREPPRSVLRLPCPGAFPKRFAKLAERVVVAVHEDQRVRAVMAPGP